MYIVNVKCLQLLAVTKHAKATFSSNDELLCCKQWLKGIGLVWVNGENHQVVETLLGYLGTQVGLHPARSRKGPLWSCVCSRHDEEQLHTNPNSREGKTVSSRRGSQNPDDFMKSDVGCCSILKQMTEEWELGLQLKPWQVISVEVARILQLIFIWLSTASLSDQILDVSVGTVLWLVKCLTDS